MLDFLRKAVFLGAGLAGLTAEKIQELVNEIVQKGDLTEKEGKDLLAELVERSKKMRKDWTEKIEQTIQETLLKLNLPTRRELDDIKSRLERIEKQTEKKD